MNHWGKSSRSQQYGTQLEFLDIKKAKFDWDDEDIEVDEDLVEPDSNPATHPGILAEISGVVMESDSEIATTNIEAVPVPCTLYLIGRLEQLMLMQILILPRIQECR